MVFEVSSIGLLYKVKEEVNWSEAMEPLNPLDMPVGWQGAAYDVLQVMFSGKGLSMCRLLRGGGLGALGTLVYMFVSGQVFGVVPQGA